MEAQENLRKVPDSQMTWSLLRGDKKGNKKKKNENEEKITTQTDIPGTLSIQNNQVFLIPHKTYTNNFRRTEHIHTSCLRYRWIFLHNFRKFSKHDTKVKIIKEKVCRYDYTKFKNLNISLS